MVPNCGEPTTTNTRALDEITKFQFANRDELLDIHRRLQEMAIRLTGVELIEEDTSDKDGKVPPKGSIGTLKDTNFTISRTIINIKATIGKLEEQG